MRQRSLAGLSGARKRASEPMSSFTFHALIALAGSETCSDFFTSWMTSASPWILAADGGADSLLRLGLMPDYLVGDSDSLSREAEEALPAATVRIKLAGDKDYTDGELAAAAAVCLSCGRKLHDPRFFAPDGHALYKTFEEQTDLTGKSYAFLNYTGVRTDHVLANLALARLLVTRGATVFLTDGVTLGRIVQGPAAVKPVFPAECFDGARVEVPGKRFLFSVLPLDHEVDGLHLSGLKWGLDGVRLPMGRSLALSNRADGLYPDQVPAGLDSGTVLFYTFPEGL